MKPIIASLGPATVMLVILSFLGVAARSADADPTTTGMAVSILSATSGESREKEVRDWRANPQDYKPDGLSDYSEDYTEEPSERSHVVFRETARDATNP
jgi:hypothetical protein